MTRSELMRSIALATGITLAAGAAHAGNGKSMAPEKASPMGYEKSGNPKAAGGPENPGVGNPFNAY